MTRDDWADTQVMPWSPAGGAMIYASPRRNTLREVLTTCFHDRRRIALAFVIPFILAVVASFLPSPKYISEGTLLLRLGREYIYKPEVGDANAAAPMAYDREQTLHAEVEILLSRDVKQAVIAKLGVAAIYPAIAKSQSDPKKQIDAALLEMQRNFDALLLKDSNVVHLTFAHADPKIAAKVLGEIIDVYLERRRAIFNNSSANNAKADVESLRLRLGEAESRLDELKRTRNIQSFAEQQSLLLAQSQSIEMKLADNALALAQATGRSAALKASLSATPVDVQLSNETQRSESVESARKTLLDLRLKERDLSSKFSDDQPSVIDVRADIARTEAFMKDLESKPSRVVRTGRSPVRDGVESDYVRSVADQRQAMASRGTLLSQRDALVARLTELAASQRQLETFERDRKLLESAFETATRRYEEDIVLQHLDESRKSNVSIVQPAREPLEPKSVRTIILAVGTVFAIACALLMAFISALWRDTFLSPDDVQRELGLPLLAAVPRVKLA